MPPKARKTGGKQKAKQVQADVQSNASDSAPVATTKGKSKAKAKQVQADVQSNASDSAPVATNKRKSKAKAKSSAPKPAKRMSAQRREEQLKVATKNNPEGVRVIPYSGLGVMYDDLAVLSGYLNFDTVGDFREWYESGVVSAVLERWYASKKKAFGVKNKKPTTRWNKKEIFQYISNPPPEFAHDSLCMMDIPLPTTDPTPWHEDQITRAYATYIVAMSQLMATDLTGQIFTGSPIQTNRHPSSIGAIHVEDWYRAYQVLSCYDRHQSDTKSSQATTGSSNQQNSKLAAVIEFMNDDEMRKTTAAFAPDKDEDVEYARDMFNLSNPVELLPTERATAVTEELGMKQATDFDAQIASLGKVAPADASQATRRDRTLMPEISKATRNEFLRNMGSQVRSLWPENLLEMPKLGMGRNIRQLNAKLDTIGEAAGTVTEGGLDAMGEKGRQEFIDMQAHLTEVSATSDTYDGACDWCGLDPANPMMGDRPLRTWQVTAVAWLTKMLFSPLRANLLGDEVGLGKSNSALGSIVIRNRKITEARDLARDLLKRGELPDVNSVRDKAMEETGYHVPLDPNPVYKPNMVVSTSSSLGVWPDQLKHFPELKTKFFVFSSRTNPPKSIPPGLILGTRAKDLRRYMDSLDPTDPATGLIVVITTYDTWANRSTLYAKVGDYHSDDGGFVPDGDEPGPADVDGSQRATASDDDEDEEGSLEGGLDEEEAVDVGLGLDFDEPMEDAVTDGGEGKEEEFVLHSRLRGRLGLIIADEGHRLKNPNSKAHEALLKCEPDAISFLTATPMINRAKDIIGIVSIPYFLMRLRGPLYFDDLPLPELKDYDDARRELSELPCGNLPRWNTILPLLRPKALGYYMGGARGTVDIAHRVLSLVCRTFVLRRAKGQKIVGYNGKEEVLGSEIPPHDFVTVELQGDATFHRYHDKIYRALVNDLEIYVDDENPEPWEPDAGGKKKRVRRDVERHLQHIAFDPSLDRFRRVKNVSNYVRDVEQWYHKPDAGFGRFHAVVCQDGFGVPPTNRVMAARYLCNPSPKLMALCAILHQVVAVEKKKLLIFVGNATPQWKVELLLKMLHIEFLSIRAKLSQEERMDAVDRFNNSEDPAEVLVCNSRVGSQSMNLQAQCSDVCILDVPDSANIVLQISGRILRMGQRHRVRCWLLTVDGTYDQVMQARMANKFLQQVGATSDFMIVHDDVVARMNSTRAANKEAPIQPDEEVDVESEEYIDAKKDLVTESARIHYKLIFGVRSDRENWNNVADPKAKNALPEEAEFRARVLKIKTEDGEPPADDRSDVQTPGGGHTVHMTQPDHAIDFSSPVAPPPVTPTTIRQRDGPGVPSAVAGAKRKRGADADPEPNTELIPDEELDDVVAPPPPKKPSRGPRVKIRAPKLFGRPNVSTRTQARQMSSIAEQAASGAERGKSDDEDSSDELEQGSKQQDADEDALREQLMAEDTEQEAEQQEATGGVEEWELEMQHAMEQGNAGSEQGEGNGETPLEDGEIADEGVEGSKKGDEASEKGGVAPEETTEQDQD